MSKQRIVIDLYDHTPESEVADILDSLRGIGIDGARFERQVGALRDQQADVAGWAPVTFERPCPDCGSSSWAGIRCYGDGHGTTEVVA